MAKAIPIYVTRPTADNEIGAWCINGYIGVAVFIIVTANIIGWGIHGLVALAETVL